MKKCYWCKEVKKLSQFPRTRLPKINSLVKEEFEDYDKPFWCHYCRKKHSKAMIVNSAKLGPNYEEEVCEAMNARYGLMPPWSI